MDKNFKNKFILMIVIILIVIVSIIVLLILLEKNKINSTNVNISNNVNNSVDESTFGNVVKVENKKKFFTVAECISKSISDEAYFIPLKMNLLEGINIDTYGIYGLIMDKNYDNFKYVYYIVKLDSFNETYEVNLSEKEYRNLDEIDLKSDDVEIKYDGNNKFSYLDVNDEFMISTYMDYYKKIVLSNSELLYNDFLDEDYKNKKFGNESNFKQYIDNNKENIININPIKYSIDNFTDYKQYTIQDNFNNYYIIKENGVMNFTMLLDNYTINTDEFNEKYDKASDKVKISTNIDKIFKMINNKEYKEIYDNYLNSGFKNNYFSNYTQYEDFMKSKFFDYNYVGNLSIDSQGTYYIVNVNYKEGLSSAAEERKINIIMQLNENTDFEISFEMKE